MAMSEAERKEARRLAAKKWYETHKKAKHAAHKPKTVKRPKAAAKVKKPTRKADNADKAKAAIEKRTAKLVLKGAKAVAAMKSVIKDAAMLTTDAHKTGDEKLVDSVMSKLMRALCLGISPVENGKGILSSTLQAAYRVPKAKAVKKPEPGPDVSEPEPEPESVEVPVGDANDVESAAEQTDYVLDGDGDEDDPDDDLDEDDPDEDSDEDDQSDDDDYGRGREDMFREFGEMGVGEEDS